MKDIKITTVDTNGETFDLVGEQGFAFVIDTNDDGGCSGTGVFVGEVDEYVLGGIVGYLKTQFGEDGWKEILEAANDMMEGKA